VNNNEIKWIKFSEQLPPEGEEVIFLVKASIYPHDMSFQKYLSVSGTWSRQFGVSLRLFFIDPASDDPSIRSAYKNIAFGPTVLYWHRLLPYPELPSLTYGHEE